MSKSLTTNETGEKPPPLPKPDLPFTTGASYFAQLWAFKLFVSAGISVTHFLKPRSSFYLPTRKRTYPCRPLLENRVFIPENYKAGELLPLYLDIHGGGFAICSPLVDDEFCRTLSERCGFVVVSVNYSKTPSVAFPVPTHDVAAIVRAVIDDDSLPIDKSCIAIGGFSAGGNLALSASQLPELRGEIMAAVPIYPVVDFTINIAEKNKSRPYRNPSDRDMLNWMAGMFDYGYLPSKQDLRDPLLSVSLAPKEVLPQWIFTIGAEYDLLANEAREMMYRLAEVKDPSDEEQYAFERGNYRWVLVRDVEHGFTHAQVQVGEKEKKRIAELDQVVAKIGEWLVKGPFAK